MKAVRSFWVPDRHTCRPPSLQMDALEISTEQDFKNHNDLPLARIKRIMKSDEDVRMISAEAPVLFAKACEMFILELTKRYVTYRYSIICLRNSQSARHFGEHVNRIPQYMCTARNTVYGERLMPGVKLTSISAAS